MSTKLNEPALGDMQFSFYYFCDFDMATTITLSSGHEMPVVGLGTWQLNEEDVEDAVTAALDCGYRHIDTAFIYENEEAIGRSLKKWFDDGNERENLFITTKLPFFGNRASDVETYLKLSLERLGLDYVDMYLIHAPIAFVKDEEEHKSARDEDGNVVLDMDTDHLETWKAMEAQVENGLAKSIGLSNFTEAQILNIIENSEIKPSNLQVELHAYFQQRSLREFCAKHDIVVTAYSSLGSPGTTNSMKTDSSLIQTSLLEHQVVQAIAEAHDKTPAQILLRHQVQTGLVVIPKSTNPERIAQNIDIFDFELSDDEMQQLDELDQGDDGRIFSFSRIIEGCENHPECPF
ncbi:aldo-keto reductase family 1 member A1 isoform X1 [Nasonia vitripennis]|uniref:NADP-dependent oxidoreductase domain-containing protein n=3 Tax=Nasonia vitripennis TaxID=7425 RepID=A0A7M7H6U7_NASVI|nr:aldo-keto reductase family 1 member A1 isoform X1 [Nasonia vitripennis]